MSKRAALLPVPGAVQPTTTKKARLALAIPAYPNWTQVPGPAGVPLTVVTALHGNEAYVDAEQLFSNCVLSTRLQGVSCEGKSVADWLAVSDVAIGMIYMVLNYGVRSAKKTIPLECLVDRTTCPGVTLVHSLVALLLTKYISDEAFTEYTTALNKCGLATTRTQKIVNRAMAICRIAYVTPAELMNTPYLSSAAASDTFGGLLAKIDALQASCSEASSLISSLSLRVAALEASAPSPQHTQHGQFNFNLDLFDISPLPDTTNNTDASTSPQTQPM